MSIPITIVDAGPPGCALLQHTARLLAGDLPPLDLDVDLAYSADDPFAVLIDLRAADECVTWVLSRETLVDAVRRPTGDGSVHAWPAPARGLVCLRLDVDEASAVVELDRGVLAGWLDATLDLVPAGSEPEHIRWDAVLAEILREG